MWGKGGEMTQTLYAHINRIKSKKKITEQPKPLAISPFAFASNLQVR
jgi:hypothetical protein